MKQLTETMDTSIDSYFQSEEKMAEYLKFMTQFHNYSLRNTALIQGQFKGAQAVGSYNFWKEKGFQVQKGEKALKILVPNKTAPKFKTVEGKWKNMKYATEQEREQIEKGKLEERKSKHYFSVGNVFDVSQTNAKASDLPKIFPNKWMEGDVKHYDVMLESMYKIGKQLNVSIGEPFEELGAAKGVFYHSSTDNNNGHIGLNPRNGELQNVKTLLHELAHARLHNPKNVNYKTMPAEEKEYQAEMTAYAVASYFNIDTSDYSLPYLANWTQNKEMEDKSKLLEGVRETSIEFIGMIEPDLIKEHNKDLEQQQTNYEDGLYWYEMLHCPVSVGCQPKGFVDFIEEKGNHGIVAYERELSKREISEFEMLEWNITRDKEKQQANKSLKQEMEVEV
ncbi:ArdC-like ssDNA-binding domain-containing protein [Lentibacillus amyloliquefaciens]|uniref:ArdC-like ssDNA-binding domain-containing protein n=1 Tax=Lentibacillus amyloliquefaciens TaxID=1472767 RepID=UPI001F158870|nr:ArdC-like ssDNA-binding domain-containing protein [Lentibacillus amyloliquefaciens]